MSDHYDLIIRNAKMADADALKDIGIRDQKIKNISRNLKGKSEREIDAEGRLTSPSFVDPHMHLDKAFSGGDAKWDSRKGLDAVNLASKVKPSFTYDDIKKRAKKSAEIALLNGTTALRTHIDVDPVIGSSSLKPIIDLKEECAGWIDIQTVAFIHADSYAKTGESLAKESLKLGAEVIGAVAYDPSPERKFELIFEEAQKYKVPVDIHIDETNDPEDFFLEKFVDKALIARSRGYNGSISASHACSLSAIDDSKARRVIEKIKRAKINIIANPLTNLYLWHSGRPNGITRVKELLDAGVNVAYGTDNTEDMFNPLGNADMLLGALFMAYLLELKGERTLETIYKMGTSNSANCGVVTNHEMRENSRADLVIFDAENIQEAIIRQSRRLYVVKNGNVVVENGELLFQKGN